MRKIVLGVIALYSLCDLIGPALADSTAISPAATETKPDPVVCRSMSAPTGTRLGARRVCQKQSEWDQMEQTSHQTVNEIQQQGLTNNLGH
jgi:hypothetical protein